MPFPTVLARAREGDEAAFAALYRSHHPRLSRYLTATAGADGEDLAHDVWCAVAEQLPSFEGDERGFRSWLFTIAHRRRVDHLRKKSRRDTAPWAPEDFEDLRAPGSTAGSALGSVTVSEALDKLSSLPPNQAEVVLLAVLGDLDAPSIGAIVGKRAGTVRVLQHRGLRRLAEERAATA
ncbi:MAG: RNA polymerase sigma factor [Acidimicrobiia bacterium]|nr:RNA polymerase sigma factor [Acidimicrobiia bacterium]